MHTRSRPSVRRRHLAKLRFAVALCPAVALAGDFIVTPTDLQFGAQYVGETSSIEVVIVNASGVSQTPNYSGGAPSDGDNFGGAQDCAGVTLPPGGSCTFTYEFHPVSPGPKSSSTTIGIDDTSYAITMAGVGQFPIAVGPLFLDFGNVVVGSTRSRVIVFTNVSGVPQAPAYSGGAPLDAVNFGGAQACAGVTLPPGGSCSFTYEFHPVVVGPVASSTTIGVDGESFGVSLFGSGVLDLIFEDGFE